MKKIILNTKTNEVLELEYSDISELKRVFKDHNVVIEKHTILGDVVTLGYNIFLLNTQKDKYKSVLLI